MAGNKKELANFYSYLCTLKDSQTELAKRLLLFRSMQAETEQNPNDCHAVVMKIMEKTKGRKDTYP